MPLKLLEEPALPAPRVQDSRPLRVSAGVFQATEFVVVCQTQGRCCSRADVERAVMGCSCFLLPLQESQWHSRWVGGASAKVQRAG